MAEYIFLIKEPVLDDLPEHAVEDLRGDLAGVRGGLPQLVVALLLTALKIIQSTIHPAMSNTLVFFAGLNQTN